MPSLVQKLQSDRIKESCATPIPRMGKKYATRSSGPDARFITPETLRQDFWCSADIIVRSVSIRTSLCIIGCRCSQRAFTFISSVHLSALGYLLVSRRPYPEAKSSSQRTTHGILQVEPNQPARSLRSGDIHNAAPCVSDLNASASVDKRRRGVPRAHFKSAFATADNGPKRDGPRLELLSSSSRTVPFVIPHMTTARTAVVNQPTLRR